MLQRPCWPQHEFRDGWRSLNRQADARLRMCLIHVLRAVCFTPRTRLRLEAVFQLEAVCAWVVLGAAIVRCMRVQFCPRTSRSVEASHDGFG